MKKNFVNLTWTRSEKHFCFKGTSRSSSHGTLQVEFFFPHLCSNILKESYSGVQPQLQWQMRAWAESVASVLRALTSIFTRTCVSVHSSVPVHASANHHLWVTLARLNWCKQCMAVKDEFSNAISSDKCSVQFRQPCMESCIVCFKKKGKGRKYKPRAKHLTKVYIRGY